MSSTESPLRSLGTARPRRRPTEAGIAILEVLVAGVLLSIALVGVALMFSLGRTFVLGQGDQRVALYLAEQKLETLRTQGHDTISHQLGTTTEAAGTIAGFPHFLRVTTVTALPDSDGSGFPPPLQLTVTVTSTIKAADQTVVTGMLLHH